MIQKEVLPWPKGKRFTKVGPPRAGKKNGPVENGEATPREKQSGDLQAMKRSDRCWKLTMKGRSLLRLRKNEGTPKKI